MSLEKEEAVEARKQSLMLLVKAVAARQSFEKSDSSPVNMSANIGYTDGVKFAKLRESILALGELTASVDKALLAAFDGSNIMWMISDDVVYKFVPVVPDADPLYNVDAWQELEDSDVEKDSSKCALDDTDYGGGGCRGKRVKGTWGRGEWVRF